MCGIAGTAGKRLPTRRQITETIGKLVHRGPDFQDWRTFCSSQCNVSLIHTRLNIIDRHERANQPFGTDRHWLIFNGEIYNHIELRDELQKKGVKFKTQSDTEVLYWLLRTEGGQSLEKCEGMWALAYYSEDDQTLLLSRDRFGEKPLYCTTIDETFFFASETAALRVISNKIFDIDGDQLYRYLFNGYRSLNKRRGTYFKGIEQVTPGSVYVVKSGRLVQRYAYWQPQPPIHSDLTFQESVKHARKDIEHSLELALRSDAPLAFCLSGGVDSTALVSLASRVFGSDVHGFTVANTDQFYDEREMVIESVRALNIRHTWVSIDTNEFISSLSELIAIHDAPISTITSYVQWRMMRLIAEHGYRVAVMGTGADEIYSGYYDHHLAYLKDMFQEPSKHKEALRNWQVKIAPLIRNPFLKNPDRFISSPKERDYLYGPTSLIDSFASKSDWREVFHEENFCKESLLRNRMMNELCEESVPTILHEDDLNSMSYSVENRAPFLNHRVFEGSRRIPTRHLIHKGLAKAVLREAVRDVAPAHVIDCREKVGFNASLEALLDLSDPNVVSALTSDGPIFEYIKKTEIKKLISSAENAYANSGFLFGFLNAKIFLEQSVAS